MENMFVNQGYLQDDTTNGVNGTGVIYTIQAGTDTTSYAQLALSFNASQAVFTITPYLVNPLSGQYDSVNTANNTKFLCWNIVNYNSAQVTKLTAYGNYM